MAGLRQTTADDIKRIMEDTLIGQNYQQRASVCKQNNLFAHSSTRRESKVLRRAMGRNWPLLVFALRELDLFIYFFLSLRHPPSLFSHLEHQIQFQATCREQPVWPPPSSVSTRVPRFLPTSNAYHVKLETKSIGIWSWGSVYISRSCH